MEWGVGVHQAISFLVDFLENNWQREPQEDPVTSRVRLNFLRIVTLTVAYRVSSIDTGVQQNYLV